MLLKEPEFRVYSTLTLTFFHVPYNSGSLSYRSDPITPKGNPDGDVAIEPRLLSLRKPYQWLNHGIGIVRCLGRTHLQ